MGLRLAKSDTSHVIQYFGYKGKLSKYANQNKALVTGSPELVATADKLAISEDFKHVCITCNRSIFTSVQVCGRYLQGFFKVIDFFESLRA